jgi:hypothetical protein
MLKNFKIRKINFFKKHFQKQIFWAIIFFLLWFYYNINEEEPIDIFYMAFINQQWKKH